MKRVDWLVHLPTCVFTTAVFWYMAGALAGLTWLAGQLTMWSISYSRRKAKADQIAQRNGLLQLGQ